MRSKEMSLLLESARVLPGNGCSPDPFIGWPCLKPTGGPLGGPRFCPTIRLGGRLPMKGLTLALLLGGIGLRVSDLLLIELPGVMLRSIGEASGALSCPILRFPLLCSTTIFSRFRSISPRATLQPPQIRRQHQLHFHIGSEFSLHVMQRTGAKVFEERSKGLC